MSKIWKKIWKTVHWLFGGEEFVPEKAPVQKAASRFGPKGFWGWIIATEAESFSEEPVVEMNRSRFGKGGFWRWLFAREPFEEEPEISIHKPRFGGTTFFRWLVAPEGDPATSEETLSGHDDTDKPSGKQK